MHRPSAIASRWIWELAKTDTVGGAVIAIIIVVSFLSLMSFAEFLRFQWGGGGGGAGGQQPQQGQQQQQRRGAGERRGRNNNGGNNRANNHEGGAAGGAPIEGEIDDIILHHHPDDNVEVDPLVPFINHLMAGGEDSVDGDYGSIDTDSDGGEGRRGGEDHGANANDIPGPNEVHEGEHDGDHGHLPPPIDDEEDQLEAFMRAQEDQEMMDGDDHHRQHRNDAPDPVRNWPEADHEDANDVPDFVPQQPPLREVNVPNANPRPREDARFEPQFEPLRPAFEGADMDAQDDGPVSAELLIREVTPSPTGNLTFSLPQCMILLLYD
jgi:E3 ubiquitin-protein ligase MARCH6